MHGNYDKEIKRDRPDIILSKENSPKIIFDAKYKFFTNNREDKHQLNWYLGRFDLQIGFLIYPMKEKLVNKPEILKYLLETYSQHDKKMCIFFIEIDLSSISDKNKLQQFVENILVLYNEKYDELTQSPI